MTESRTPGSPRPALLLKGSMKMSNTRNDVSIDAPQGYDVKLRLVFRHVETGVSAERCVVPMAIRVMTVSLRIFCVFDGI